MTHHLFSLFVLVIATAVVVPAQESVTEQVTRAAALNDQGNFRAAIELVEALLHSNVLPPNDAMDGVAWNIRGLALQSLGERDEARRSYEAAIRILRVAPSQHAQFASALDNLGSLKADMGQFEESKSLRIRAKQLYESVSDHAGVARTLGNLALVAMGEGKGREARRYLDAAFSEESKVPAPNVGDLAGINSAQCLQDERDGHFGAALPAINRAIDLWTQQYGADYYLLAPSYSLRGRAYEGLGDNQQALNDLKHSIMLLKENGQTNSRVYLLTEISYAQVLRKTGLKSDATRIESDARTALQSLSRQQCARCTTSAESLR